MIMFADRGRIALAVDVHELDRHAEDAALVVESLHGDLGAAQRRLVERRLNAGQAERAADEDFLCRLRSARKTQAKRGDRDGRKRNVMQFLHYKPPWLAAMFFDLWIDLGPGHTGLSMAQAARTIASSVKPILSGHGPTNECPLPMD
jgi:hypothetical protein